MAGKALTNEELAAQVATLAAAVQAGTERMAQMEARFATGEERLTKIEAALAALIVEVPEFKNRLTELEAAARAFNGTMGTFNTRLSLVEQQKPAPSEERLSTVEHAIGVLTGRVSNVERARARGGALQSRLTSIEAKLDALAGGGGTTTPQPS